MEQPTTLKETIEELQDLKIEVVAHRMLINVLKAALEISDPRLKKAFSDSKNQLVESIPTDADVMRQLRARVHELTKDW